MLNDISKRIFTPTNVIVIVLALLIIYISVYFRAPLLQFYGFYEPDGFYYYSVIRAAVNNGFQIPSVLSTSGYPNSAPTAEARGVYYVTLIPYAILQYFGVSYYTVMRVVPVAFGLLDMLGAYLLSRYLSKDKFFGLLVIAFVGFSMGNAARTSATIYRGDTFVTFFLLIALVVFVEVFRQTTRNRKITVAVLAGIALAFANFVWDGAAFADAIFLFSLVILLIYAFILRKEQLINDSKYILLSIFVWYAIVLYASTVNFAGGTLSTLGALPIYLAVVVLWALIWYVTSNIMLFPWLRTETLRLAIMCVAVAVGLIVFIFADPSIINSIFVANGFITTPGSFGTTIQELQPPTASFLYTSFGVNLYTTPQTLLMYLPTLWGYINPVWVSFTGAIGVLLLFILFVPYLFMQIYDSGGFLSGKARVRLDLNLGMIILMSYFIITAYLQMHAIRFNSLVSVPIAILSAYTMYWLITAVVGFGASRTQTIKFGSIALCVIFLAIFFYYLLSGDAVYSQSLSQADSVNTYFINALQWMKINTPPNSVVLTLWPDGSLVEGVGNRTSVTDSVGSQNGSKMTPFAAWILNGSNDPQFLQSSINGRPNYLLVRFPWLIETQGIYTEAVISENQSLFGYLPLTQYSEELPNSTSRQLIFRSTSTGYPYAVVNLQQVSSLNSSSQSSIYGFIQESQTEVSPFQTVGFYNQNTGNYTLIPQSRYNSTNGELMLILYSSVPHAGFFLNITGAYIFGPGLAASNMLKFLYFCNSYSCSWNNNEATMQVVYQNADTKIIKINYNTT